MANPVIRGKLGRYEGTPYADYVTFISRNVNKGTRENPVWYTIENPYMQVDGRVQEAQTEHAAAGKQMHILTELVSDDDTRVVFKCIVTSDLHGSATGWSVAKRGGEGVESSSPYEVAETSAVGRALGLMGYGLIPMAGIASANEVQAKKQEAQADKSTDRKSWATRAELITRISDSIEYFGSVRPHIIKALELMGTEKVISLDMTDDQVYPLVEARAKKRADEKASKVN